MTQQGLSAIRTPEEEEVEAKQTEIARLQDRLAEVEEQIEALKTRLARFDAEYTRVVAPFYYQLDRWKLRCEEVRWSMSQLQQARQPAQDAARPEARKPSSDDLRRQREEAFRKQWDDLRRAADESARPTPLPEPVVSPDDDAELKRLYRLLAKRFHPDLASTPEVKSARASKMAQINAAYQARDLAALRAFVEDPDIVDEYLEDIGQKLIRLIRETTRLRRLIAAASSALEALRESDLSKLQAQVRKAKSEGQDAFGLLTLVIRREIDAAKAEWLHLRAQEDRLWTEMD
jgi:hypothetical protein